jgi:hypothetical protein
MQGLCSNHAMKGDLRGHRPMHRLPFSIQDFVICFMGAALVAMRIMADENCPISGQKRISRGSRMHLAKSGR